MVGVKNADGDYSGTISQILSAGNFRVKEFVIGGDESQSESRRLAKEVNIEELTGIHRELV